MASDELRRNASWPATGYAISTADTGGILLPSRHRTLRRPTIEFALSSTLGQEVVGLNNVALLVGKVLVTGLVFVSRLRM